MKRTLPSFAAASLLAAVAASAQTTGVSRPEALNDTITTDATPAPSTSHYVKPSPAVPATGTQTLRVRPTEPAPVTSQPQALVEGSTASEMAAGMGIVTALPTRPNELPEGTLIHASLDDTLTTTTTHRGQEFSAHLTASLIHDGHVLIPAGSLVRGRITEVRQAKRFKSGAMMRLQPESITLPDGTRYPLDAEIVDFDHGSDAHYNSRVSDEGAIVANNHTGARVGGLTLTTGSAAIAGAMIGGGVGALVGAGIGAGAGIIWWGKQNHDQTIEQGTVMILDLDRSLFVGTGSEPAPANAE